MRDSKIGKLGLFIIVLIIVACYLKGFEVSSFINQFLVVVTCILIIAFGHLNSRIEEIDNFKGYLVTAALHKRKEFLNDNFMGIIAISIIVQVVILLQNNIIGEYTFYLLLYIVSYSISIEKISKLQKCKVRNIMFLSWLCIVIILGGKSFLGDIVIFEKIISFYASSGLGLGIFLIITNNNLNIFKGNGNKHNRKSKIYKLGENNII